MTSINHKYGPLPLSAVIAALLTTGCADFDLRRGLMDDNQAQISHEYNVAAEKLDDVRTAGANNEDAFSEANLLGYDKKDPRFYLEEAAKIAVSEGNYLAAAGHWRKLLESYPYHKPALYGFSQMGRKAGVGKPILSSLFKAIAQNPADSDLIAETAKVHYSMGQYNQALKQVDAAIQVNPNIWKYYSLRGAINDKMNLFADAAKAYDKALMLSPNNAKILNNYAVSRLMAGDYAKAEAYSFEAAQAEGADIRTFQTYARVLGKQGRYDEAEKFLEGKVSDRTAGIMMRSVKRETASPVLWGR